MITSTYKTEGANETEWVTDHIVARLLSVGDFLPQHGQFVETTKNGTAWTHVVARDGKKLKFAVDEVVEVEREKLTEAAKAIRNREFAEESLRSKLDKNRDWEEAISGALDKAREQMTSERRYSLSSQMDYLMEAAVLRARADVWRAVVWMFDDEESQTRDDAIASFLKAEKMFTKDIMGRGRYGMGPLSRSSSLTSNLAEDIEVHERRKFLDDIEWELLSIKNG